jgi:Winged helix-turn-helix DNA-binding
VEREKLLIVRALIDAFLALPEDLQAEISRLLASESPKPNGHDPHPVHGDGVASAPTRSQPGPHIGKARRRKLIFSAKTAERKLLAAMQDNPGLSVIALANAAGSSRSATGERLRQLAARGKIEKGPDGKWKLKGEEPRPPAQGEAPDPRQPSPN